MVHDNVEDLRQHHQRNHKDCCVVNSLEPKDTHEHRQILVEELEQKRLEYQSAVVLRHKLMILPLRQLHGKPRVH